MPSIRTTVPESRFHKFLFYLMQAVSIAAMEPRGKSAPSEKIEPSAECLAGEMIQFNRPRRTQFYFARALSRMWNLNSCGAKNENDHK